MNGRDKDEASPASKSGRSGWFAAARAALVLGLLLAAAAAWRGAGAADWLERHALAPVRDAGPIGWVAAVGVYALATVLLVPGSALTLALGEIYGPWLGTLVASAGATLGASLAFLLARTLARGRVGRWAAADPRFAAVDRAIAERGALVVFLLRLSPVFPFNVLNYALGATGVRFLPYLIASWVGMLPGAFLYVMLGSQLRPGGASAGGLGPWGWGAAALATLFVTLYIGKVARDAIRRAVVTDPKSEAPPCQDR